MANNITYISTFISFIIVLVSLGIYLYVLYTGEEFGNISLNSIKIDNASVDNMISSGTLNLENIYVSEKISSNNIFSRIINSISSTFETLKSNVINNQKTINTQNYTNYNLTNSNDSIITGSIYYTLYNSASMIYQDDSPVKINNCTCFENNYQDCNQCLKIDYVSKNDCKLPLFFGSSPISYREDIWRDKEITNNTGFVCAGLSECNNSPNNIFNKNSLYWRTIIVYDNKPIVDINPYYMALYLTNLYFAPVNLYTTDKKLFYSRILYNTFIYNASNFSDFENVTNGSSYIYGNQDFGPNIIESSPFYNPFGTYGTYDNQFIGPQNGCIYSCSNCEISPSCNSTIDINGSKNKNCTCFIPYVNNDKNKGQNLLKNLSNTSINKVLSVVKYLPPYQNVNDYNYVYNNGFTTNPNGVKIQINHKNYPNNYKSNIKNNFGAMHRNTHSSLSSYKDEFGNNSEICGEGISSINPFDFGECEIILDYSNKNLTKTPIVEAYLNSEIRFQFQGGYSYSCFVKNVSTKFATIILRNFPMDNLVSNSALTGFFLNYKIYLQ